MIRATSKTELGFSTVEILVVLSILMIASAFAVLSSQGTYQNFKATSGMNDAMGQFQQARAMAISTRRNVEISFSGTNQIQLTPETTQGVAVAPNPIPPETLVSGMQFVLLPGVPDTPMGFGTCANGICFKAAGAAPVAPMRFTTTGALMDFNNKFVDGTLFLGIPGKNTTARAITILGATGRVRPYYYDGAKWNE
jgi:type II secretory pathway pseudopilin PulG